MIKTVKKHTANEVFFGSGLIVLSAIFYGSYGIWTRLMGNSFGPYMQAWIRALLVVLIMLPIALFGKQKWERFRWREDKWWFLLSALASLMLAAPLYYAINKIGISLAILMMYAGYLLSMFFFGWLFNKERYGFDKFIATFLALAGLLLTFSPPFGGGSLFAFAAALAAGISIGLDMAVSQKLRYNSSQTTIVAWGTGLIVNLPVAFILGEHTPGFHNPVAWLYLLIFAVANIAASWLSIHGVKLIEAGAAGIIGLLEIIWAMLFGVVFFGERPETLAYFGAVCIIIAAAIPYIKEFKSAKNKIIEELPS